MSCFFGLFHRTDGFCFLLVSDLEQLNLFGKPEFPDLWRLRQAWCFRDIRGVCSEDLISEFRSTREISLPLCWPVSLKGESVRGAAKRIRLVQELAEQRAERAAFGSRSRRYSRSGAAPSVSIRGPLSESLAIVPAAPLAVTPISFLRSW